MANKRDILLNSIAYESLTCQTSSCTIDAKSGFMRSCVLGMVGHPINSTSCGYSLNRGIVEV